MNTPRGTCPWVPPLKASGRMKRVSGRNTRNTWKYPRLKEIPGNTRSHILTLLPDPNPTRYPVFCPIPDPTRYWKTLPAGHCLAEVKTMDTTYFFPAKYWQEENDIHLGYGYSLFFNIHTNSLTLVLISVIFTALFPTVTMFTSIISAAIPWDSLSESNLERLSIYMIESILRYTQWVSVCWTLKTVNMYSRAHTNNYL